ncbi:MAG: hypothetical protein HYR96_03390 [Deltaproteobacteria bacterium]|nr:hypothetical protein [Deltaproteobacteria bacterium]
MSRLAPLLFVCGILAAAPGGQVLKVDGKQARMAVTHLEGAMLEVGSTVLVGSADKPIAWGIVTRATQKGALVQITHRGTRPIAAGMSIVKSELPTDEEIAALNPKKKSAQGIHPQTALAKPNFMALFDLLLTYQPKNTPSLTFQNDHSLLLLKINPTTNLEFAFEVSPNPRFFELDYDLYPGLEFRVGRIWIPFDEDNAHKYYGGRPILVALLQPNASTFLPEIWTDMGVGVKVSLLSIEGTEVALHGYVVNGFGDLSSGDPNPDATVRGQSYPDFSSIQSSDNNDNKAVGGRIAISVRDLLSFGASVYRGSYPNRGTSQAFLNLFGLDGKVRLGALELRGGNIYGEVELVGSQVAGFRRGGYYGEIGLWVNQWKVALRGGQAQQDSRFLAVTDQTIGGAIVSYHPGALHFSVEYSRDFEAREGKTNTDYAAVRMSAHF